MAENVYPAIKDPAPEAVVIYCSDPRFQPAFDEFIEKELGLAKGQFVPLVVAGGANAFTNPLRLPKEFKFMKDRLELYQERFSSIKRIVLIGHEDCKYYDSVKNRILGFVGVDLKTMAEHHKAGLAMLPKMLATILAPQKSIEIYYAKFKDPDQNEIIFEPIKF
jgi:hypothetical protein